MWMPEVSGLPRLVVSTDISLQPLRAPVLRTPGLNTVHTNIRDPNSHTYRYNAKVVSGIPSTSITELDPLCPLGTLVAAERDMHPKLQAVARSRLCRPSQLKRGV